MVPPLCIGTYTLTKVWNGDPLEGERAVRAAVDGGLGFFDTARAYGGAEAALARALADTIAHQREELVLCGKGGFELRDRPGAATPFVPNSRPEHLRQCLTRTLRNLGTDHLDIYLVHWPDPEVPVEEVAGAMGQFVAEGLARQVGVSNYSIEAMTRFASVTKLDVVQIPYNLFAQEQDREVIPYLHSHGTGIMGYAALAQGFLTGAFTEESTFPDTDFRSHTSDFQGANFRDRVVVAHQLAEIATDRGVSLPELAIAWVRAHPAGVVPIAGVQTPTEVTSNLRALELQLTGEEFEKIGALATTAPPMDFAGLVQ